jgi:hypothetical protein
MENVENSASWRFLSPNLRNEIGLPCTRLLICNGLIIEDEPSKATRGKKAQICLSLAALQVSPREYCLHFCNYDYPLTEAAAYKSSLSLFVISLRWVWNIRVGLYIMLYLREKDF